MHVVRRRVNFSQAILILAFCSLWRLEFLTYIIFFSSFVESSDSHYVWEGKKQTSYLFTKLLLWSMLGNEEQLHLELNLGRDQLYHRGICREEQLWTFWSYF